MNILITGANGLLGRNLVEILSKKHRVFAVVKKKNQIKFKLNKNISVIETDLCNLVVKKLPKNIDVIYYLAQSNDFRAFPEGIKDMISLNILTPTILAKWGTENGVKKFIYFSSGGVYLNQNKLANEIDPIDANKELGFYLNTKLSAEMLLKNYLKLYKALIIVRPFFMYGIGQKKDMLIPRLISSIRNEKEISIDGKEGIKISPIYITDAANATAKIINLNGGLTINIGGDEIISLKKLVLMMGAELKKKPIIKNNNQAQNDLIGDNTKMKLKLYKPKIKLKIGIKKINQWMCN